MVNKDEYMAVSYHVVCWCWSCKTHMSLSHALLYSPRL